MRDRWRPGRAVLDLAVAATTGAVIGVVRRRNGSVIPGATVVVTGTVSRTQADESEEFTLPDVPLAPTQTPSVPLVPQEILAIKVYSTMFSAPPQYQRRDSGCGVILVWTKRGVPNRKQ